VSVSLYIDLLSKKVMAFSISAFPIPIHSNHFLTETSSILPAYTHHLLSFGSAIAFIVQMISPSFFCATKVVEVLFISSKINIIFARLISQVGLRFSRVSISVK
jgi:hypothetical protein